MRTGRKNRSNVACRLFIALLLLCPWPAAAQMMNQHDLTAAADLMERKIGHFVRGFDAKALVYVSFTTKRPKRVANTKMPSTPFVLDSLKLDGPDQEVTITGVQVDVFTADGKLEQAAGDMVKRLAAIGKAKVGVKVEALPAGYQTRAPPGRELMELVRKYEPNLQPGALFIAGSVALVVLLFLVFVVIFMRQTKKRLQSVDQAVGSLVNAIQESGGGAAAATPAAAAAAAGPQREQGSDAADAEREFFRQLSDESLLALISDCYWCEQDAYGAWVWNRISVEAQNRLLKKVGYLDVYAGYLRNVTEGDSGYVRDPYYLTPQALEKAGNDVLTEKVRADAGLLKILPEMRIQALDLGAVERLEMQREANEKEDTPQLPPLEESELRTLHKRQLIRVKTVDEEKQLMEMQDLELDAIADIPSLIWTSRLQDEGLEKVLGGINARDLASAWVGPEEVLSRIEGMLPPRKKDLLGNFKESVKPDRNSPAMMNIHQAVIAGLRQEAAAKEEAPQAEETAA